MKYASVICDIATQALDTPYTYAIPDGEEVTVGCGVVVPFGHQFVLGFVIAVSDEAPLLPQAKKTAKAVHKAAELQGSHPQDNQLSMFEADDATAGQHNEVHPHIQEDVQHKAVQTSRIKPLEKVVTESFFDEEGAACARYIARRYVAPLSACIRLFTPPGALPRVVNSGKGRWRLEKPKVSGIDDRWVLPGPRIDEFSPRKNAIKQRCVIETVRTGSVRACELIREFGDVNGTLQTLAKKHVVTIERRRRLRQVSSAVAPSTKPVLTQGQMGALDAIKEAYAQHNGTTVVVDGVTGSGKTEVYLQAIEHVLDQGNNAIVLVPEISLTPQTVARFRGRFGDRVAVMHSRMSNGERFDQWDFIRSGQASVVVGARSALFTPLRDVGIIVIDEEHEGTYKQESAPRYHARDVAQWMAQRRGACVVLGSATPSIDTLYEARTCDSVMLVQLPERANKGTMPTIEVVDMAQEFQRGSRSMFSTALMERLKSDLEAGHKVVLLLNQRGFAKFLLCRDCGFVPECPSCSTSLTYHDVGSKLVCHHCGYTTMVPVRCPECESPYLKKFGAGTQRVEADLRALVNNVVEHGCEIPIIRMDADTTRAKGAHERLLESFAAPGPAVLLGTQMIAKGLDFDEVTLVGVINADTQLHLPDYRASERTFSLIEQVAGRAGRKHLAGHVIVQTYEADALAIRAAAAYDRALFLEDELPKRELLGYPPYVRLANVLVWGEHESEVREVALALRATLAEALSDARYSAWRVLPATPCVLEKLRGEYRWHVVVKCPRDHDMSEALSNIFRSRKTHPRVNVAVDIDPLSLL